MKKLWRQAICPRSPSQQVTGALLRQTMTYLIPFNPHKTTTTKALSPFRRWRNCIREADLSLVPPYKWQILVTNQSSALPPNYTADVWGSVSNSKRGFEICVDIRVHKSAQARIFLHSLVLEKSFWCVSASALSLTTCFLCSAAWQLWKGTPPEVMELVPSLNVQGMTVFTHGHLFWNEKALFGLCDAE